MNKVLSILAAAVLAGGWLLPAATASEASSAGRMRVEDKAGAFTPDGIKKAEEAFQATTFQSPTHLTVVTVGEIPASRKADYDAVAKNPDQRGRFFESWARELAQTKGEKGVFVLMFVDDKRYIVRAVTDQASDLHRSFTDANARTLVDKLSEGAKRALGKPADQAKAERDAALLDATSYVVAQLKDTSVPVAGGTARTASSDSDGKEGGGTNIMGYVCIGLAALLGVWLVVALIRAFTGGGGGGGPGGGGGYGGGGGGFFPSLMGGLFGAAAGMYLYNSFMGGDNASASDSTGADSGDAGAADTGEGNYDEGASAGSEGGDWGDSGGDAGGGDWGGGDAGGGDFGGGDW